MEKISDFTNLPLKKKISVIPWSITREDSLKFLGLHVFSSLRNVEDGKLTLDHLFKRHGCLESFNEHQKEFVWTHRIWKFMRLRVIVMILLGTMVFLKRFYHIIINLLPIMMNIFAEPHRFTLTDMVLAEVCRSLSTCYKGHTSLRVVTCYYRFGA